MLHIVKNLKHSPKAEVIAFEGVGPPKSPDPCEALAYNGYMGIEPKVVDAIAEWIKAATTAAR